MPSGFQDAIAALAQQTPNGNRDGLALLLEIASCCLGAASGTGATGAIPGPTGSTGATGPFGGPPGPTGATGAAGSPAVLFFSDAVLATAPGPGGILFPESRLTPGNGAVSVLIVTGGGIVPPTVTPPLGIEVPAGGPPIRSIVGLTVRQNAPGIGIITPGAPIRYEVFTYAPGSVVGVPTGIFVNIAVDAPAGTVASVTGLVNVAVGTQIEVHATGANTIVTASPGNITASVALALGREGGVEHGVSLFKPFLPSQRRTPTAMPTGFQDAIAALAQQTPNGNRDGLALLLEIAACCLGAASGTGVTGGTVGPAGPAGATGATGAGGGAAVLSFEAHIGLDLGPLLPPSQPPFVNATTLQAPVLDVPFVVPPGLTRAEIIATYSGALTFGGGRTSGSISVRLLVDGQLYANQIIDVFLRIGSGNTSGFFTGSLSRLFTTVPPGAHIVELQMRPTAAGDVLSIDPVNSTGAASVTVLVLP